MIQAIKSARRAVLPVRGRALHTSHQKMSAWSVPPVQASAHQVMPPVFRSDILRMKREGTPLVCITAYDQPTALAVRGAGADMCLVGDSLANVALGYQSTRSLSLDAMIHHAKTVRASIHAPELQYDARCPRAPLVIVDMPFGSYGVSLEESVRHVMHVVKETQASAIKMEGSMELVPLIERLTTLGIDVMGHIGLQPQRFGDTSGFRVQGATAHSALSILRTAQALEAAGCFSIVLECIPSKLGEAISQRLDIPTIGIGAGPHTHGQVLVCTDIMGDLTSPSHVSAVLAGLEMGASAPTHVPSETPWPPMPKFVRTFAASHIGSQRIVALRRFAEAVRSRTFPDNASEAYRIKTHEWDTFLQLVDSS